MILRHKLEMFNFTGINDQNHLRHTEVHHVNTHWYNNNANNLRKFSGEYVYKYRFELICITFKGKST